jgi:3-oxoacyl-[acyl-carrier protein] reductase
MTEKIDKGIVIVTGASRGIGHCCACRWNEANYHVIGLARDTTAPVPFEMRQCDVTDPEAVGETFSDLRRNRRVFALINAAGVASMNLLVTMPARTVRRVVETNLLGTIYCCQAVAPALIRRGDGRIINFSTIAVELGIKGEAVYVASKAGVEGFSRAFAREMADHGVTVNSVAPGPVDTDLIAKVPKDRIADIVERQIIPRQAEPDDVWNIVSLLLSPRSSMISGEVFHVGGV